MSNQLKLFLKASSYSGRGSWNAESNIPNEPLYNPVNFIPLNAAEHFAIVTEFLLIASV